MEASVQVALIGLIGVLGTALVGAYVALSTNKIEKEAVAETAIEKVMNQRLTLKDEQLKELEDDNGKLTAENAALLSKVQVLSESNGQLREQNRKLKRVIAKLTGREHDQEG